MSKVTSREELTTFAVGEPNTAYAQYFIGQSFLNPYKTDNCGVANVTFEPGCRNNWHIHHKAKAFTKSGVKIQFCSSLVWLLTFQPRLSTGMVPLRTAGCSICQ